VNADPRQPPVVLTIAGSDNSGGAGIQADLKTISAYGCYALTAVTCVVAEVPGRVSSIQSVRQSVLREQIALSLSAFPVAAVKTGMLYSGMLVGAVADQLALAKTAHSSLPVVVDPVMVATSGHLLLQRKAVALYRSRVFPLATIVTPNVDELRELTGRSIRDVETLADAGKALSDSTGCAVLAKGGHLRGEIAVDLLISAQGVERFEGPFVPGVSTHGTGCTLSAAIASGLALGDSLSEAVRKAKLYVYRCIRDHLRWNSTEALSHFSKAAF